MTDNEIIKAWKCCVIKGSCDGCPYKKHWQSFSSQCLDMRLEDTFDLINRQKAEIERLQDVNIRLTKAEAIKEFAERLKAEMVKSKYVLTVSPYARACNAVIDFWATEIDNLVKEMVGDEDG